MSYSQSPEINTATITSALVTAQNQLFALSTKITLDKESHEHLRQSISDAFKPFVQDGCSFDASSLRLLKREIIDSFELSLLPQNPQWKICRSRIFTILGADGLGKSFSA